MMCECVPCTKKNLSTNVVSVKLIVSYNVTMLFCIVTLLVTINLTLKSFCAIDTRAFFHKAYVIYMKILNKHRGFMCT